MVYHRSSRFLKVALVCIFLGPNTFLSANDKDDLDLNRHGRYRRNAGRDISDSSQVFESASLPLDDDGGVETRYMPFVGNGHLATTIYSDTIYVNGVYNGRLGNSHRARIPSFNAIRLRFQDNALQNDATESYKLHVSGGQWEATLEHPDVTASVVIYAHQFYHHLLVTRVTVARNLADTGQEFVFTVSNNRGADSPDIMFSTPPRSCSGINIEGFICNYMSGNIMETETDDSERTTVHVFYTDIPSTLTLGPTESSKTWLFVTSIDINMDRAREAYAILNMAPGELDSLHLQQWRKNWDLGRIELGGDLALRKVLYASQYYLKSSLPAPETFKEQNEFYGVSPGGLGRGAEGQDYQGHVFWDMETWVFPVILLLQPSAAKDMLNYRVNRMAAGQMRARADGYKGVRFPWESAFTGAEVTPDICTACRENEQHVTADIAFAARQYVSATRDIDWLRKENGCEFIMQMADFWVSRAEYDPDIDRYHIRGVMPPDEYHTQVDDSVFTNVGASLSIHMNNYTACLCNNAFDETQYRDVATKLVVPFDEEKRYHPAFEGYSPVDGLPNAVYNNITNNRVKQADAILLGYPFLFDFENREARVNDLNIYRDVIEESSPAMTWAMFSVGYREIGDDEKQQETFMDSYLPYVCEPFKVWTEAREGMGATNFLSGMGGFLQAIMFGYGGFRLVLESLYFNATLPPRTTSLTIVDLDYLGSKIDFHFTGSEMKITVVSLNNKLPLELELLDEDRVESLEEHRPPTASRVYTFPLQASRLYTTSPSGCPLPIDSVLPLQSAASPQRIHWHLCLTLTSLLLCVYAVQRRL